MWRNSALVVNSLVLSATALHKMIAITDSKLPMNRSKWCIIRVIARIRSMHMAHH